MKDAKRNFWKKYKYAFGIILFIVGLMVFSSLTNDIFAGMGLATVAPLVFLKGGKFDHELTEAEFSALKEEDQAIYIKELNAARINTAKRDLKQEMKDGYVSKEDYDKTLEAFKDISKELQKLKESGSKDVKEGTFSHALKTAYEGMRDKFKANKDIKGATMNIKALPLTTATWTGSTNYPFLQDDQEEGVARAPRSPQSFNTDIPTGSPISDNSDTWTWIEEGTIVDGTVPKAENATFGEIEVGYFKGEVKVKKIPNKTKITREMLEDWDEFLELISDLLATLVNEKLNSQLFSGDGTGANMLGITGYAVEFDAKGVEETNANIWDSIKVGIAQIYIDGKTNWIPTDIYMHPSDVVTQEIEKDSTGNYVFPPFLLPGGLVVSGIPIKQTTDVPTGYFLICDITKSRKRFKRALEVKLWEQNDTDVEKDLLTITASLRAAFRIKLNDVGAFVYDSFDTAISIIKGAATALAAIQAMAVASDASKLTINQLIKAGVTSTDAADLGCYKTSVAGEASIANLAALQVLIDAC